MIRRIGGSRTSWEDGAAAFALTRPSPQRAPHWFPLSFIRGAVLVLGRNDLRVSGSDVRNRTREL